MSKIESVKRYVTEEIKKGRIAEGKRVPGCREVARILSVNKITVNKAYKALEEEHLLYCVPRGGYYVIKPSFDEAPISETIDFQTVAPDSSLIPYRAFTHAMNRSVEENKKKLFFYEPPIGIDELRETLKEKFERDGIYAPSSQIVITNGAQQGIFLALKSVFKVRGEGKLLVESPTYNAVTDMSGEMGIKCETIRRGPEGLDLKELESILQTGRIKAFYVVPRYHNPTGYSLSESDKKKIAELCGKNRVLIIEDDYLADLGADRRRLPLHYYDTNRLTVYIRSFSKTFLPGIRLGAVAVPEDLRDEVVRQKYLSDICTSGIAQGALNFFIRSGMYDRHIRKVNACYRRKLARAKAILSHADLNGLSFHVPKQGLFLWISPPAGISADRIAERLRVKNILVSRCPIPGENREGLRLCIAGVPEKDLGALEIVVKTIEEEIGA